MKKFLMILFVFIGAYSHALSLETRVNIHLQKFTSIQCEADDLACIDFCEAKSSCQVLEPECSSCATGDLREMMSFFYRAGAGMKVSETAQEVSTDFYKDLSKGTLVSFNEDTAFHFLQFNKAKLKSKLTAICPTEAETALVFAQINAVTFGIESFTYIFCEAPGSPGKVYSIK